MILLIFLFLFLGITFGFSAVEKTVSYSESVSYYSDYFKNSFLKNYMKIILPIIILLEIITTILFLAGIFDFFYIFYKYRNHHYRYEFLTDLTDVKAYMNYGFGALFLASFLLILFLIGQRIAKDYDGARNIAIYFILCLIGFYAIS